MLTDSGNARCTVVAADLREVVLDALTKAERIAGCPEVLADLIEGALPISIVVTVGTRELRIDQGELVPISGCATERAWQEANEPVT